MTITALHIGDAVKLTREVCDANPQYPGYATRVGRVVGYTRQANVLSVQWSGLKHPQTWHRDSLERVVQAEDEGPTP